MKNKENKNDSKNQAKTTKLSSKSNESFNSKTSGSGKPAPGGGSGGTSGMIVEETGKTDNFDNKTADDARHEREMNHETGDNTDSHRAAAAAAPSVVTAEKSVGATSRSYKQHGDVYSQYSRRDRPRSPPTDRTDRSSLYRKSVFTIMRENTEFEQFRSQERELLEQERLAKGGEARDDQAETLSARTRTTNQTTATNFTKSTAIPDDSDAKSMTTQQVNKIKKDEKLSEIGKFLAIIEENNVAVVIKYVDVYALKLLVKLEDNENSSNQI